VATKSLERDNTKAGHVKGPTTGPLLVIVGETASGKSSLALQIATHFKGEIICADSWTVRRGTNIGTAKPTDAERNVIPHHLIDVVDPDEEFTAAIFKRLAIESINDITSRGKLPILVGGTGLYVDSILYNYEFLPPGDRKARELLNSLSCEELLSKISEAGLGLGNVDIRNKRRLIRLLETQGARQVKHSLRSNTLVIGLKLSQDILKDQITRRVDRMLSEGLENEVKLLVDQYGWSCEGLKGVGYAQWRLYFDQSQKLDQVRENIIKATLGLAKRQRTWFKRNKSIHWFITPVNQSQLVDLITTKLYK
jgi:tRNA dimethylallyltransferase